MDSQLSASTAAKVQLAKAYIEQKFLKLREDEQRKRKE